MYAKSHLFKFAKASLYFGNLYLPLLCVSNFKFK